MKITHNKVGQNLNVRENPKAEKSDKNSEAGSLETKDLKTSAFDSGGAEASSVNLSTRAQDIKRAKDMAMAAPEINQEKVERLQKLIDDGKYKTDAREIANKMVDEHLSWE